MAIEIRELRMFDCDAAAALLQAHGEQAVKSFDAAKLQQIIKQHRGLSLVAKDDDKIVGLVLAFRRNREGFVQHVTTDPAATEGLARDLANACAAKLVNTAIGKCKVRLATDDKADAFWRGVQWTDCPEFEEPIRYYKPISDDTDPDDPTCPWKPAA